MVCNHGVGSSILPRSTTHTWVALGVCGGQTHSIVRHGIDLLLSARD